MSSQEIQNGVFSEEKAGGDEGAVEEAPQEPPKSINVEKLAAVLRLVFMRKHMKHDNMPVDVFQGRLFIGSIGAAYNKTNLLATDITHVLCVAGSIRAAFEHDFVYQTVDVRDKADEHLSVHFETCHSFIDECLESGGKVLIHCFAGVSRSSTVLTSYLMKHCKWTRDRALEHIRLFRPQANPNSGFMQQLSDYESSLRLQYPELLESDGAGSEAVSHKEAVS